MCYKLIYAMIVVLLVVMCMLIDNVCLYIVLSNGFEYVFYDVFKTYWEQFDGLFREGYSIWTNLDFNVL